MNNREKFEHYATTRNLNIARKGGGYVSPVTDYDWQAWQAAIDSVVIQFPPKYPLMTQDEVKKLLDKAGIKYE